MMLHGFGPVSIAFTDRRVVVTRLGEYSVFPSPRIYSEWKRALTSAQPWRFGDASPFVEGSQTIWAFANPDVIAVTARPLRGLWIDRDTYGLRLVVPAKGILVAPSGFQAAFLFPEGGGAAQFQWRVPGEPQQLLAALRRTALAPVASDRYLVVARRRR